MKKRIFPYLASMLIMTGCSSTASGNSSVQDKTESAAEIITEKMPEGTSGMSAESIASQFEPIADSRLLYIDLTKQSNFSYRKKDAIETEYEMRGFGKVANEDNGDFGIVLTSSDGEKRTLIVSDAPQGAGGWAMLRCKIDESRFAYTIGVDEYTTGAGIYDLETESAYVIKNNTEHRNYPYQPMYVSGNYLILYTGTLISGKPFGYSRLDLDTHEITSVESEYFSPQRQIPNGAFSADGTKAAAVSYGVENNGMFEYDITVFSPDTGEKLDEYHISVPEKHPNFSLEFTVDGSLYVYASRENRDGWSDLYIAEFADKNEIEYILNRMDEYPIAQNVEIEPIAEKSRDNLVYFTSDGYYYTCYYDNGDIHARGLYFDNGSGEPVLAENTGDCTWSYVKDDVIYGTHHTISDSGVQAYACKCENGRATAISNTSNSRYNCVYTDDYIYYKIKGSDSTEIYRMDYSGRHHELVFSADDAAEMYFSVSGSRIYYSWYDVDAPADYKRVFGIYDMETKKHVMMNEGGVGVINGGYMYYRDELTLMRINLEDYTVEKVLENIRAFDFQGSSVVYVPVGMLNEDTFYPYDIYRYENGVSTGIFNANDVLEAQDDTHWVIGLQCRNDEIIVKTNSAKSISYVLSIDNEGRLLKKYYEEELPRAPHS